MALTYADFVVKLGDLQIAVAIVDQARRARQEIRNGLADGIAERVNESFKDDESFSCGARRQ